MIAEAQELIGARTKRETVDTALREMVARHPSPRSRRDRGDVGPRMCCIADLRDLTAVTEYEDAEEARQEHRHRAGSLPVRIWFATLLGRDDVPVFVAGAPDAPLGFVVWETPLRGPAVSLNAQA